mgnify:CR=1 FL=1
MSERFKLFPKVGKTRIIPLGLKILVIFICLILLSNFATNVISVQLEQKEIITLNNEIMVDQLKELYNTSSTQYQIYNFSLNRYECMQAICKSTPSTFTIPPSLALGLC